ncbi:hypothetical protein HDU96_000978 [Phlyctochytrium bullatum]|nr:hypothetical protein HDU96_000978 [Phlyctochytrium bullatum]
MPTRNPGNPRCPCRSLAHLAPASAPYHPFDNLLGFIDSAHLAALPNRFPAFGFALLPGCPHISTAPRDQLPWPPPNPTRSRCTNSTCSTPVTTTVRVGIVARETAHRHEECEFDLWDRKQADEKTRSDAMRSEIVPRWNLALELKGPYELHELSSNTKPAKPSSRPRTG